MCFLRSLCRFFLGLGSLFLHLCLVLLRRCLGFCLVHLHLFLGFGQVWRGIIRDEELRRRVAVDPHSPAEFRVNGIVRNVPEFYTAFGVTEDDELYLPPEERVKIW